MDIIIVIRIQIERFVIIKKNQNQNNFSTHQGVQFLYKWNLSKKIKITKSFKTSQSLSKLIRRIRKYYISVKK